MSLKSILCFRKPFIEYKCSKLFFSYDNGMVLKMDDLKNPFRAVPLF
jgi:hypothetical protein